MSDAYDITVTTKSVETHDGLMNRLQPEIINGFIGIAREDGGWVYLAPGDVLKWSTCQSKKSKMTSTTKEGAINEVEAKI